MRLSNFIRTHIDAILADWDEFARGNAPVGPELSDLILRDHAREMLDGIAKDMESLQTSRQQVSKSRGERDITDTSKSAAGIHGALRHRHDFSILQLSAEFRTLRATVLRLWLPHVSAIADETVQEIIRFNEAIDQALAESIVAYVRESDQARHLFLAVLGHDLRSPLANMAMAGAMLSMKGLRMEQLPALGATVHRSARLMQNMVDDLLGYTRTQLGKGFPMTLAWCDVGEVLEATIADASATHPGVQYDLRTSGDLAACYDATRLHQLFLNLLANAGQHGARSHPVTVDASATAEQLVVRVNNHGPAIPRADLESIFKPLVQLSGTDDSATRPRTSLGLGLFIAREIAEGHGGGVTVTSDDAGGTTFTVVLPREASCRGGAV